MLRRGRGTVWMVCRMWQLDNWTQPNTTLSSVRRRARECEKARSENGLCSSWPTHHTSPFFIPLLFNNASPHTHLSLARSGAAARLAVAADASTLHHSLSSHLDSNAAGPPHAPAATAAGRCRPWRARDHRGASLRSAAATGSRVPRTLHQQQHQQRRPGATARPYTKQAAAAAAHLSSSMQAAFCGSSGSNGKQCGGAVDARPRCVPRRACMMIDCCRRVCTACSPLTCGPLTRAPLASHPRR
jgi:hypothetical protein